MVINEEFNETIKTLENDGYYKYFYEIINPLVSIRDKANSENNLEIVRLAQYEIDAFRLCAQSFIFSQNYNKRFLDDYISIIEIERLDYYLERLEKSNNIQFKCRYADILITAEGAHKLKNKYEIAVKLIPMLMQCANLHLNNQEPHYVNYFVDISRAVEVSLSFKMQAEIVNIIEHIMEQIGLMTEKSSFRWMLELSEIIREIYGNKQCQSLINDNNIDKCLTTLESSKEYFWTNKNHSLHRAFCEELVVWKKILKNPEQDIKKYLLEIGNSFEVEAEEQQGREEKSALVSAHFLEQALKHYCEIGETSKIDLLKVKIREKYLEAQKNEFKLNKYECNIPAEHIDMLLNVYKQLDLEECLTTIGIEYSLVPNVIAINENVQKQRKEAVMLSLIKGSIVNDGKKIFAPKNNEELSALDFGRHYCLSLQINSQFLMPLFQLLNEKGFNKDAFMKLFREWDFCNERNAILVEVGMERYFAQDYISSVHILVPQLEACVRNMFALAGYATTSIKSGMGQHEETFNQFLERQDVKDALGIHYHKYIEMIMVNQTGWNLRNNVAHGLGGPEIYNWYIAIVIIHLYLLLFNYKSKKTEE